MPQGAEMDNTQMSSDATIHQEQHVERDVGTQVEPARVVLGNPTIGAK